MWQSQTDTINEVHPCINEMMAVLTPSKTENCSYQSVQIRRGRNGRTTHKKLHNLRGKVQTPPACLSPTAFEGKVPAGDQVCHMRATCAAKPRSPQGPRQPEPLGEPSQTAEWGVPPRGQREKIGRFFSGNPWLSCEKRSLVARNSEKPTMLCKLQKVIYIYIYVHIYVHTCIYIYIHIYIYIYICCSKLRGCGK